MKCKECYTWRMHVDSRQSALVELCPRFIGVFGNNPSPEIIVLAGEYTERLEAEIRVLYTIYNKECLDRGCRLCRLS